MPLQALSNEVLSRIFDATTSGSRWVAGEHKHTWYSVPQHLEDIKRLRMTCRQFRDLCTDRLFQTASLYQTEEDASQADTSPRSSKTSSRSSTPDESDSVSGFTRILNHPELRHQVRNVMLSTSVGGEEASDGSIKVSKAWRHAASNICKFPKLSSVQINFRELCMDDDDNDADPGGWVTEDEDFRATVLETVLGALNRETCPANNLRSLAIKNLQNKNEEEIIDSSNFKHVLSKVQELHLLIAVQISEASPESYVLHNALYDFFDAGLRDAWLKPASQNLTRLTLYTNTYWGWVPGFDARGIRFPNVRYLALGNYTFAHDWQIEWLTSHFADLETFIMVDCPILFHMHPAGCLDRHTTNVSHEDHIKLANPRPFAVSEHDDDSHWTYPSRWHHFFPKFEARMPNLTKFVYTHDGWPNLNGMEQALDERDRLRPSFRLKRYAAFNGTIGPSQWEDECDADGVYENFTAGVKVMTPAVVEPPYQIVPEEGVASGQAEDSGSGGGQSESRESTGCQKQDEEAFNRLLRTVALRARAKGVS